MLLVLVHTIVLAVLWQSLLSAAVCEGFTSLPPRVVTPSCQNTICKRRFATALSTRRAPDQDDRDQKLSRLGQNTTTAHHRRTILQRLLLPAGISGLFWGGGGGGWVPIRPPLALALKERNEALCGTGFFTNIALYKCTEIGDISDEGRSPPLSRNEEGAMKSLLGRMGLEDVEIVDEQQTRQASNGKKQSTKQGRSDSPLNGVLQ